MTCTARRTAAKSIPQKPGLTGRDQDRIKRSVFERLYTDRVNDDYVSSRIGDGQIARQRADRPRGPGPVGRRADSSGRLTRYRLRL